MKSLNLEITLRTIFKENRNEELLFLFLQILLGFIQFFRYLKIVSIFPGSH